MVTVEEHAMVMLQGVRCKFGWHHWGPIAGDVAGCHHECTYCRKVKPIDTGRPPDTHDKSALRQ